MGARGQEGQGRADRGCAQTPGPLLWHTGAAAVRAIVRRRDGHEHVDRRHELNALLQTHSPRRLRGLSAEAHQLLDRLLLRLVFRHTRGNQVQAARVLGLSRQTLRARTRELGLSVTGSAAGDEEEDE